MRQNFNFPAVDIEPSALHPESDGQSSSIHSRLAFVQVGIWELRRRWLTGQTEDVERLLAHLDEDVERLSQALAEAEAPAADMSDVVMS